MREYEIEVTFYDGTFFPHTAFGETPGDALKNLIIQNDTIRIHGRSFNILVDTYDDFIDELENYGLGEEEFVRLKNKYEEVIREKQRESEIEI